MEDTNEMKRQCEKAWDRGHLIGLIDGITGTVLVILVSLIIGIVISNLFK